MLLFDSQNALLCAFHETFHLRKKLNIQYIEYSYVASYWKYSNCIVLCNCAQMVLTIMQGTVLYTILAISLIIKQINIATQIEQQYYIPRRAVKHFNKLS